MVFLDNHGYPVETVKGKWFGNFIRRLIHTRRIVRRGMYELKVGKKGLKEAVTMENGSDITAGYTERPDKFCERLDLPQKHEITKSADGFIQIHCPVNSNMVTLSKTPKCCPSCGNKIES